MTVVKIVCEDGECVLGGQGGKGERRCERSINKR